MGTVSRHRSWRGQVSRRTTMLDEYGAGQNVSEFSRGDPALGDDRRDAEAAYDIPVEDVVIAGKDYDSYLQVPVLQPEEQLDAAHPAWRHRDVEQDNLWELLGDPIQRRLHGCRFADVEASRTKGIAVSLAKRRVVFDEQ